jgi:hypothetical protein
MSDMKSRLADRVKLKDAHVITRMADIAEIEDLCSDQP